MCPTPNGALVHTQAALAIRHLKDSPVGSIDLEKSLDQLVVLVQTRWKIDIGGQSRMARAQAAITACRRGAPLHAMCVKPKQPHLLSALRLQKTNKVWINHRVEWMVLHSRLVQQSAVNKQMAEVHCSASSRESGAENRLALTKVIQQGRGNGTDAPFRR